MGWIKAFFIHSRCAKTLIHTIKTMSLCWISQTQTRHSISCNSNKKLHVFERVAQNIPFYLYCVSHIKVKMFTSIAQPMYAWVVAFKVWISMNLIKQIHNRTVIHVQICIATSTRYEFEKKIHPWLPVEKINLRK